MGKYKDFVDQVSFKYQYPSNISHLLQFIVPGFVFYYGIAEERLILDVFSSVRIVIQDRQDEVHQAAFSRTLEKDHDGYRTIKCIFLYRYNQISLMQLLDNLIHEFNHAVNSMRQEIYYDEEHVYVRTGLTYLSYQKETLHAIDKQQEFVLEEIINTRQTEKIIDLIASFSKYSGLDLEISNLLYAIHSSSSSAYQSHAYYLQATVCQELLKNTTFIHTLEKLRLQGEVQDLDHWFDTIVGSSGSFQKFAQLLKSSLELTEELLSKKFFRNHVIHKIRSINEEIFQIVENFNQNCNFR